ncbi:MAG: ATP-binding protein [Actinomycetota bacterium]
MRRSFLHRFSLTARIVAGGLVVAAGLWFALDMVQTRQIEAMIGGYLTESLDDDARRDRLLFDQQVRLHLAFAGMLAQRDVVRQHGQAVTAGERPVIVSADEPPWLPPRATRRSFPPVDAIAVSDHDGRIREVIAVGSAETAAAVPGLPPRVPRMAVDQPLITSLNGRSVLVSAAPLGRGGHLLAVSALDTRFLAATIGRYVANGLVVALMESDSGLVVASSSPVDLPVGTDFHAVAGDWRVAGKAFFDYGSSEVRLTFASLMPAKSLADLVYPLLHNERAQRTGLAAAMSGLFMAVLIYLGWRLRRLVRRVSEQTRLVFGVVPDQQLGGDEVAALEGATERLVHEVAASRKALARETAERVRLATERVEVWAENERLRLLQGVTALMGIGVIRIGVDGPIAENAVMADFARVAGGLEPFLAARARGEASLVVGEGADGRVFETAVASAIEPGMILVEDVTERRRQEEALVNMALLPSQNPHAVLRIDAGGVIREANPASAGLLASWNAAIGRPVPEPLRSQFADILASGTGHEVEAMVGDTILSLTVVPLVEHGYVNIYASDVTARVAAERQLQQSKESLERRVAERTRALEAEVAEHIEAQRALERAKEQAELANRAKTELLANISHELRTPLNAIIGFSEIMTSELFGPLGSERYRTYAEDIHGSGRHLLAVINDILDIAKIEAGEMTLDINAVDLGDVASAAARIVEGRAEMGSVRLLQDLPPGLPPVAADRRRLLQIFVNLLSNAVKFTPEGGTVHVGAEVDDAFVSILVADTGIGMSADEVALALQPFRQVDGGLARRYEGTGLGLPLAKSFVDLHGGSLEISSTKGGGTTVTVRLPRGRAADAFAGAA